jgi:hypothetical protein
MKTTFPKLTFAEQGSGVAPTLGHPLVDNYLESVSARLRRLVQDVSVFDDVSERSCHRSGLALLSSVRE